ncbi:hypothetical protein VNI00_002082 [Paramarasmius palmivorus]|uniref:DRBM domain-containing protein n=1 Tax=Paramarasmius palmivorus TaxID=297713 RepID=A0AAW0E0V6_9AGAR
MSSGSPLPKMPRIETGDFYFALWSHDSLPRSNSADVGDMARFEILGRHFMEFTVTEHYIGAIKDSDTLEAKTRDALSPDKYRFWFDEYELQRKLVTPPGVVAFENSEASHLEVVGAIYHNKGPQVTKAWIIALIDPNSQSEPTEPSPTGLVPPPSYYPSQPNMPVPPEPASPPPPSPSVSSPSANGVPNLPILALFNQYASQLRLDVRWEAECTGPPHQPTWSVRCLVNNQIYGQGSARNQKLAKDEAARQAWAALNFPGSS